MVVLYPLRLEPLLKVLVWGGRQLETRLLKTLPPDQPVGESWEIYWKNTVSNGPHAGKTLGEVIAADPEGLTGDPKANAEFPLLVKFLDAQQWLSVQVHPNDAQALELEGQPRGKTECWYVLAAAPGARLAFGLSEPLDADSYRVAIMEGRTKDVLQYVPVQPGDFIYMPAGTQHALGEGILIYELQQMSDTTYRVYDWDRVGLDGKPRELHLEKALKVTDFRVNPPAKVQYMVELGEACNVAKLVRGQFFNLDRLTIKTEWAQSMKTTGAHLLTAISGRTEIRYKGGEPAALATGQSVFMPAGLGEYRLVGKAEVLCAWVSRSSSAGTV